MASIPKSVPDALPFELLNLQHWFGLAYDGVQKAHRATVTSTPQTPEGEALQGIYQDLLALCLETMREASTAHLPEELAAHLAFQQAELEWLVQHRRGKRKAVPVRAAAD